ncbi:biotin synthase BioB [Fundidesulfovibrio putealis]|uniref:radical SAM protein n=1 Tax=Fundidesulfovibrio putealis TaxID=270496 RepID=UPI0006845AE6|nr:radical SAM protein [Fundidesulfovibrio putealis]
MRHIGLSYDEVVHLLAQPVDSVETMKLRKAAHDAALHWTDGRAQVWYAIGLDCAPCPNNCSFCSFGHAWGIVKQPWRLEDDHVLALIHANDIPGVGFIALRTTDQYPVEDLLRIARRVRPLKHARLVANIGDFSPETAHALHEAGFSMAYHALRLREGQDTLIDPDTRLRTMQVVRSSHLELAALVDPVGAEHSPEEIADSLFLHKKAGASVSGAMARVGVEGTPKFALPTISQERLAQITAVARLVAGPEATSICAHPPDPGVATSGANTLVVDSGAIPRDAVQSREEWRSFTVRDALNILVQAGYHV